MGKNAKVLGMLFLILGIVCIGMYFVLGEKFSNHKVIFDSNGGTAVAEQVIKNGGKAVKPTDPTKEDNEFIEWQLNGAAYNFDNVVTSNITLKANWKEVVKHNIKVTLEDKEYTADIVDGELITLEDLEIPEKEGYTVKFYNESDEEFDITTKPTSDMVLKAKYYEIKTFTVKFNSNGGSKVDDIKAKEGTTIEEPKSTKDGYVLDGWYIGEEKFNFETPISKDITLKARWNDGEKINVIFKVDDTVYKTISVRENTKVSKPSNPTKKGYKFVEWQLDGKAFDFNTKITEEITLTAVFEESTSVTVTFNSDGGSAVASQEVETGGKAKQPTAPTKNGYKFIEWDYNGKKFDFNTAINDNIKLTAVWAKTYTVKFNSNGGTAVASQTVEEGEKASKPANPTKDGATFAEWLLSNSTYDFDTPVTEDIELVARYEKVTQSTDETPDVGDVEEDNNN